MKDFLIDTALAAAVKAGCVALGIKEADLEADPEW